MHRISIIGAYAVGTLKKWYDINKCIILKTPQTRRVVLNTWTATINVMATIYSYHGYWYIASSSLKLMQYSNGVKLPFIFDEDHYEDSIIFVIDWRTILCLIHIFGLWSGCWFLIDVNSSNIYIILHRNTSRIQMFCYDNHIAEKLKLKKSIPGYIITM